MASNVANSTRVWNCQIQELEVAVGPLGDLEHLRYTVPIGYSDLGYSGRAGYSDLNPNGTWSSCIT